MTGLVGGKRRMRKYTKHSGKRSRKHSVKRRYRHRGG